MFGLDINFFLDGVSFAYKRNPLDQGSHSTTNLEKTMRRFDFGCTAKGKKEGTGGKVLKLIVAISFGKGVLDCEPYDKMNGEYFKNYISRKFPKLFKLADKSPSRLWIQDGDPCQNSYAAKGAYNECGSNLLSIPARSLNINPIENLFNLVRRELDRQAISQNITQETYEDFSSRVCKTFESFPSECIDKIIQSMDKCMSMIIRDRELNIRYILLMKSMYVK